MFQPVKDYLQFNIDIERLTIESMIGPRTLGPALYYVFLVQF